MSAASTVERLMLELINEERTSRGLDPLALELRLNEASEDHSVWMDDTRNFSHTGVNGSSPGDRIVDAGFTLSGNWTWGENIAYQSERGAPGIEDDVEDLHTALMNSPGHRANILNPDFELIGIGIEVGDGRGFDAVYVTQNFARTSAEVQIDNETPPPAESVSTGAITIAGNDSLYGGAGDETLRGSAGGDTIFGRNGDDTIRAGEGADIVFGGQGLDFLLGDAGNDNMNGGTGNDRVYGGEGDDRVSGGAGNDGLNGGDGRDRLNGGDGNDTMTGGDGNDVFIFSSGRDVVRDFSAGDDIDLRGVTSITSFTDLSQDQHIQQVGRDAVIDDLAGNTMVLRGVNADDLQAGDFLF